jgi:hypothetical protein
MEEEALDAGTLGRAAMGDAPQDPGRTDIPVPDEARTAEVPLVPIGAGEPVGEAPAEPTDQSYLHRLDARGFDQMSRVEARRRARRSTGLVDVGRRIAAFFLTGFSTVELVAIAVAYLGLTGYLWLNGTIDFERLFTDPLLRSMWLLLVLAMLRPITWLPYMAALAGYRRLAEVAAPRRSEVLRNALANAATILTLLVVGIIAIGAIPGATGAVRGATAIVLGNGSFDDVGAARVDWTLVRVLAVLAAVVLGRLFVPPLGPDLDRSDEPILDYPSGRRGTLDRWLLALGLAAGVLVGLGILHRGRG